jgi:cellulose synthase/poly-beta-1,6-N-acetylglucosamine synthase-like glycosyltransferase/peptidoglycan/xylan/chitin deacetylase (PgdA/CDA1 family)
VGRWWGPALVLLIVTLAVSLGAHDFTAAHAPGAGNRNDGRSAVGVEAGSVIDVRRGSLRSVHPPLRHVALTFDDGPDPRWTAAILDVLARDRAPATFFVIGENVAAHPEIVRRMVEQGDEVGVHTYRHREIALERPADLQRELALTQLAIVGATGRGTSLFRPPFITQRSEIGRRRYLGISEAGRLGYVSVLADLHSYDWKRPGVAAIVRRSMPRDGEGAIIEMHDGGGDRSQTVAALRILIRRMRAQGYQFETVSSIARLPRASVMPARDVPARFFGWWFLESVWTANLVTSVFLLLAGLAVGLSLARLAFVVVASHQDRLRARRATHRGARRQRPAHPIATSVLIAAFNEVDVLPSTLRALGAALEPGTQVVVVDDGSTDGTAELLRAWDGAPVIDVVHLPHGGKAVALAAGLARCRGEVVVSVDADTRVTPPAIRALVAPFVDRRVGAVSGNVVVEERTGVLGGVQHLEYILGNALDRAALDAYDLQVTVPGACGAFRRSALDAVGGFSSATVAEDTDVTLAIAGAGWKVRYAAGATCRTSTPRTIGAWWRQRSRWSYGITQAVWRRRGLSWRWRTQPRAARAWWYLFGTQVLLPILAPLLDIGAVWALMHGTVGPLVAWVGFVVAFGSASVVAVRAEGGTMRDLRALPLLLFGYRQVLSLATFQAIAWALAGRRPAWGRIDRVVSPARGGAHDCRAAPKAPVMLSPGAVLDTAA